MSANIKWDIETTIKFIQLYKLHSCLWNFQSPEYKIKQKRDAAYNSLVQEMNITGFGTQEVKNKIKNLRSTYQQEKKNQDSKKSGAGLSNVYTSNIKWLKEMEEVFSKDLNKIVYENVSTFYYVTFYVIKGFEYFSIPTYRFAILFCFQNSVTFSKYKVPK